jgi:hypothetical protein
MLTNCAQSASWCGRHCKGPSPSSGPRTCEKSDTLEFTRHFVLACRSTVLKKLVAETDIERNQSILQSIARLSLETVLCAGMQVYYPEEAGW